MWSVCADGGREWGLTILENSSPSATQLDNAAVKQLNVSEFREQCLSLLDELPAEGVVITKRGRPIARVSPIRKDNRALIGSLAGRLKIRGNILSTGDKWNAES